MPKKVILTTIADGQHKCHILMKQIYDITDFSMEMADVSDTERITWIMREVKVIIIGKGNIL